MDERLIPLDAITVGPRRREDLGDIDALARSRRAIPG